MDPLASIQVFSRYGDAFAAVIGGAMAAITPFATAFVSLAFAFGAILFFVSLAMHTGRGVMAGAVNILLQSGFVMLALGAVSTIGQGLLEGVVDFALAAGGATGDAQEFLSSPDSVMAIGVKKFVQINELTLGLCTGWSGCIGAFHIAMPMFVASLAVLVAFCLAAFTILSAVILFHVALLAGMLLLPLAIFPGTASIGWGPIRFVIICAVQIFTLVLVISVNSAVFTWLTVGDSPGWSAVLPTLIASFAFIGMLLGASRLAYSITSSATLGAGALFGAPLGMATTGARALAGRAIAATPATAAVSAGASAISAAANAAMPAGRPMAAGSTMAAAGTRGNASPNP